MRVAEGPDGPVTFVFRVVGVEEFEYAVRQLAAAQTAVARPQGQLSRRAGTVWAASSSLGGMPKATQEAPRQDRGVHQSRSEVASSSGAGASTSPLDARTKEAVSEGITDVFGNGIINECSFEELLAKCREHKRNLTVAAFSAAHEYYEEENRFEQRV